MNSKESIPDHQTQKYDRQLRLWKSSGQQALNQAHICLLNCAPAGSEALKNLILGGIGEFTIIDNQFFKKEDMKGDFFMQCNENDFINKKRGALNLNLLKELNPDVKGSYLDEDPILFIHKDKAFLSQFQLVLITMSIKLNHLYIIELEKILLSLNIPLIVIDTIGMVGCFRLCYNYNDVIETHNDNLNDLRLSNPIDGILDLVKSYGELEKIEDVKLHSEIPYVIILLYYINKWSENKEDGLKFPINYKQKLELKELIRNGMITNDEENFEEAIQAVNAHVQIKQISKDVLNLFEDERCKNMNSKTTEFWLLIRSLYEFYINEGKSKYLPLSGSIPDMRSSSKNYISLQSLYKEQANKDYLVIQNYINQLQQQYNLNYNISEEMIRSLCKNAYYIHSSTTLPLKYEFERIYNTNLNILKFEYQLMNKEFEHVDSNLWLYLIFRAYWELITNMNRKLNSLDEKKLLNKVNELLASYEIPFLMIRTEKVKNWLKEILNGNELGNLSTTASLIGGLVAQESLKFITKHYIPASQWVFYDGINCNMECIQIKLNKN